MATKATVEQRRALQARIDELWDFDDPAGSEGRFRAEIERTSSGWGADVLRTQLARALGLQRDFDEARAMLDGIPAGADPEVAVRVRLERGRILNSAGDPEGARPEFETASELATAAGREFLAVDALHMIAIVAPAEEQPAWHDRAIAMAERAGDPRARKWLASLYNNAGWTRFERGEPDEALRLFERALDERRASGTPREVGVARWTVARGLRAVGRTEEALAAQEALRRDNAAAGTDDPYVGEELAECLLALGRADEARPHLAAAADALAADEWVAANEPERIARLRELASGG
jgi:tetratricopeptide (TPR) repeat protein